MRNNEAYLHALRAVCDALIPGIPGATDAMGVEKPQICKRQNTSYASPPS